MGLIKLALLGIVLLVVAGVVNIKFDLGPLTKVASAQNEITRYYYTDKIVRDTDDNGNSIPPGNYPRIDSFLNEGESVTVVFETDTYYIVGISATIQRHQDRFDKTVTIVGTNISNLQDNVSRRANLSQIRSDLQRCWQYAKDHNVVVSNDPTEILGAGQVCPVSF